MSEIIEIIDSKRTGEDSNNSILLLYENADIVLVDIIVTDYNGEALCATITVEKKLFKKIP